MKTKIRLTNGTINSPILILDYSNQKTLQKFVSDFKEKNSFFTNPKEAMVNFIVFAATYGKGIKPREIFEETGFGGGNTSEIQHVSVRAPNVVEFVYKKDNGQTDWRTVDLVEEDSSYLKGHDISDDNKFKSFKKSCIVGGRVIKKTKV